jgi:hypothetical protein
MTTPVPSARSRLAVLKKRKGFYLPWALTGLAFLAGWLWIILFTPLALHEEISDLNLPVGEIEGRQTVGQTFFSPYKGLYRIDVFLADYERVNSGLLYLHLKTHPEAETSLVTALLPMGLVHGGGWHRFEFDPIPDSAGKTYYFVIEAPTAFPGNAITVYTRPSGPYVGGNAYLAGQRTEGDLLFFAHYRVSGWERALIFLDQLTAGKSLIWGDKRFYVGLFGVYLALVGLLLGQVVGQLTREP